MQLFATSLNVDLGAFRLRITIGLDERDREPASVSLEAMPRLELTRE